jgi:spore coat polysaccharide biosynthesis protein SpsF
MRYKTEQEQFWSSSFGDEYSERNAGELWITRNANFFSKIFSKTGVLESVLEFGANIGLNLQGIKRLLPQSDLFAVEINEFACDALVEWGGCKEVYNQSALDFEITRQYELAFVKTVLIHINPDSLPQMYDKLFAASSRWVLIAEYYNQTPIEVNYRGHNQRLFKRDFTGEMMDRYPSLKLVDYGFVWQRDSAFPQDDITWFLLEKSST